MRNRTFFSVALGSFLAFAACRPSEPVRLRVATSANMQFAMQEIVRAFTDSTGIGVEMVVGSSGKLTAQIREGAPFHVFVSADMDYPAALAAAGRTLGPPAVYTTGRLVCWTSGPEKKLPFGLADLAGNAYRHIAIANPKTAPYGRAAVAALQHAGVYEQVRTKLVYGESIAQVNQFVRSGAADIGITALSVVVFGETAGEGQWALVDTTAYPAIEQGVVLLDSPAAILPAARRFRAFLFSDTVRAHLNRTGKDRSRSTLSPGR
jgi:molybdate transport system substrate-binding protein